VFFKVKNPTLKRLELEEEFLYETFNMINFFQKIKQNCSKKKRFKFIIDLILSMELETFKRGEAIITYGINILSLRLMI